MDQEIRNLKRNEKYNDVNFLFQKYSQEAADSNGCDSLNCPENLLMAIQSYENFCDMQDDQNAILLKQKLINSDRCLKNFNLKLEEKEILEPDYDYLYKKLEEC